MRREQGREGDGRNGPGAGHRLGASLVVGDAELPATKLDEGDPDEDNHPKETQPTGFEGGSQHPTRVR